jgi:hypothetical protein
LFYDAVINHTPKPDTLLGVVFGLNPTTWLTEYLGREPTSAETQAIYRAACSLVARGLIRKGRFGAEYLKLT